MSISQFCCEYYISSQVVLVVKNSLANAGDIRDVSLIPGSGGCPGGGHGNALQYSCHLFLISSVRSIPFLSFIEPIFA